MKPMNDWAALKEGLMNLDGDDWDAEYERMKTLWKAEYVPRFMLFALSRGGWNEPDAKEWAENQVDETFAEIWLSSTPTEAAEADVIAAENEAC
jgi:hypothetical protein